jgi:hypothetical protein
VPARYAYDEWLARFPEREAEAASLPAPRSTQRKVRILLDEDVDGLAQSIGSRERLRVEQRSPKGASDDDVWMLAMKHKLTIVTGNKRDFWREDMFPLAQSPGIVALGGKNEEERVRSLGHVLSKSWLLDDVGEYAAAPRYTRIRAVPDGSVVITEFWDAANNMIVVVDHTRG